MTFPHRLQFVLLLICCMQDVLASNANSTSAPSISNATVTPASNSSTPSANVSTMSNGKRHFCILKNLGQQNENLTVWGKVGIWVSKDMSLKKLCLIFNSSLFCFLLFSRFLFYIISFFSVWNCRDQHLFIKTVKKKSCVSLNHYSIAVHKLIKN